MATLRGWLDHEGFDWEGGRILGLVVVKEGGNIVIPVNKESPMLDKEFSVWGAAPAVMIAEDKKQIYFMTTRDGIQDIHSIYKDIDRYIDEGWLPLPGR